MTNAICVLCSTCALALQTKCLPLHTILANAGVSGADFLSLDVNGHELHSLRNMPHGFNVKLWLVQTVHIFPRQADRYLHLMGYVKVANLVL